MALKAAAFTALSRFTRAARAQGGGHQAELMWRWPATEAQAGVSPPGLAPRHGSQGKGPAVIKGQLEAREPAAKGGGKGTRIPGM